MAPEKKTRPTFPYRKSYHWILLLHPVFHARDIIRSVPSKTRCSRHGRPQRRRASYGQVHRCHVLCGVLGMGTHSVDKHGGVVHGVAVH